MYPVKYKNNDKYIKAVPRIEYKCNTLTVNLCDYYNVKYWLISSDFLVIGIQ